MIRAAKGLGYSEQFWNMPPATARAAIPFDKAAILSSPLTLTSAFA